MKNVTIVLFGATGDLSKRKIIPALYRFVAHKKLENVIVVGVAFEEVTSDQMIDAARPFVDNSNDDTWHILRDMSYYKKINFTHQEDFVALHGFIQECEQKHGIGESRLFYVATASHFFSSITDNSAQVGLLQRREQTDNSWHRIVYEKPFGYDLQSARAINECIEKHVNESQVYRIDHYLTKEIVSNIAMIRFTNCVFEPLWSNRYIDQVQIVLSESGSIEGRGSYYDAYGALRDVVQNHMLELLALVCMEAPEKLTGDYIRTERAKVLEQVTFVAGVLGQYEGYQQEAHIKENSQADTYASLKLAVNNPRWVGVPFYLKTGKCLDKKETVIHIKFKQVDCLLMRGCPTDSNWLTIQIAPEGLFYLTLNVKRPDASDQVMPVGMEFSHSRVFGLQTPEAYEVLLEEVMRGEQSIAVRSDEIESAWKLIDVIENKKLPVYQYIKGSQGPEQAQELAQQQGMRWRV